MFKLLALIVKKFSGGNFFVGKVEAGSFPVLCPTELFHRGLVVVDAFLKLKTQFSLFFFHDQVRKNESKEVSGFLVMNHPRPCWSMSIFANSLVHIMNRASISLKELVNQWFVAIRETYGYYIGARFQAPNRDVSIGIHCTSSV